MSKQFTEKKQIMPLLVEDVFESYPYEMRTKLLFLRKLIFETAHVLEDIGEIEETLKWGEPSYLTPASKSGSTIRLAWKESQNDEYAIYFKCTAKLVPSFKEKFSDLFRYSGNRSIQFHENDRVPVKELKQCIALALTYHWNKQLEESERWKMIDRILK